MSTDQRDIRSRLKVTLLGINYAPEPTGIAPYTSKLAAGLRDRGHQVQVVTTFPHYPQWRLPDATGWSRSDRLSGVDVKRVRHYVPSDPGSSAKRALSEVSFGLRAVASPWHDPDVLICPSPALLSTAVAMARTSLGKRPAVGVIVQDLYSAGVTEASGRTGALAQRLAQGLGALEGRVLRDADGVAVIHDRFRDRIVERFGINAHRVSVIRNWTHQEPPAPFDRFAFRARMGWSPAETVVLHSGAMGAKQDLAGVVRAARLAEAEKQRIRFVLLGGGGQRAQLEELAAGCSTIDFVDPLPGEAYGQALAAADVLLVHERPGLLEMAVPSKLTSYFASGRPVLAATEPASITADEVRASGAGTIVASGDPGALLDAVGHLVADPLRADLIGARGPLYCQAHLS
ncbi:MAG: glycosyltransferase family 4 protein, partial [Nocardioides sp.]|nr:glycosyltransferase family 4 protein [Nocardioides sp.]